MLYCLISLILRANFMCFGFNYADIPHVASFAVGVHELNDTNVTVSAALVVIW